MDANSGGVVDLTSVPTDAFGYRKLKAFADKHADGTRVWAIEGTGSYGAGLTTSLLEHGEWVVEIASPARPASKNCRFQFPTDCSETFARRAASATDNSPAKIDRTTRTFSSTGNTGALDMVIRLLQQVTTRNQRDLPQSLTRDTHARVSLAAGIVPSTASMGGSPGRRERAHDQPVVAR